MREPGVSAILVTGAGGKTGRAVVRALVRRELPVRAFVFRGEQAEGIRLLGAEQVSVGDMRLPCDLAPAFEGTRAVYHICPNVHPEEVEIGEAVIAAAAAVGVEHLVYHSVLLPGVKDMPHHWLKHRVEELLSESGLRHTILRPCAYMQNVLVEMDSMERQGRFRVPYGIDTRMSPVDLEDVAEAAAIVLQTPDTADTVHELCGPDVVSPADIAAAFGNALDRDVQAEEEDLGEWKERARGAGSGDYELDVLARMFRYYDRFGFIGDPRPLAQLLGRSPASFGAFVERTARDRKI